MRSLYLRIWLTVVAALALFAAVSGWLVQRHLEQERQRFENVQAERLAAWGDLLQSSLPMADEPPSLQAQGLQAWSRRLRVPMALDDAQGRRIAASESFTRREAEGDDDRVQSIRFDDGRTLRVIRPRVLRLPAPRPPPDGQEPDGGPGDGPGPGRIADGGPGPDGRPALADAGRPSGGPDDRPPRGDLLPRHPKRPLDLPGLPEGVVLLALLALLFAAVAAGAFPVVRRLTRRLEALKRGVEAFGSGALDRRVRIEGKDEVAALAASFNQAAGRIEDLLRSHQSLLANASHELRSPLARLKMALAMIDDASPARQRDLKAEIATNIAELDALVEEVLLASRLDAGAMALGREPVDLLPLLAEEAARVGAEAGGEPLTVPGDERLLRRAMRNLLENAHRYGGDGIEAAVTRQGERAVLSVCDRGPGVPEAFRERIFEPFFRLPGHAEREGGVGLGLSLVRQIAHRHGGTVTCAPRDGGGSCFSLSLPMA